MLVLRFSNSTERLLLISELPSVLWEILSKAETALMIQQIVK